MAAQIISFFSFCQFPISTAMFVKEYTRSQLASTFYLPLEEVAISAANYNYNHYNLPFSTYNDYIVISDEDMLIIKILKYVDLNGLTSASFLMTLNKHNGLNNNLKY